MGVVALRESLRDSRDAVLAQFEAPAAEMGKSYGRGKWSVHEILVHLADCEAVFLWRVSRAIAEPGSPVAGFDQDAWAANLEYAKRPLASCREIFRAARSLIIEHLEWVDDGVLCAKGVCHSEAGWLTLGQLVERYANHTRHHLGQIAAARAGHPWRAAG
jgi:uncharacterized damage-inducible protein DinB